MKTSRNPASKARGLEAKTPTVKSPVTKSLDLAFAMVDAEISKIVAGIAADQSGPHKATPRRRAPAKHAA